MSLLGSSSPSNAKPFGDAVEQPEITDEDPLSFFDKAINTCKGESLLSSPMCEEIPLPDETEEVAEDVTEFALELERMMRNS